VLTKPLCAVNWRARPELDNTMQDQRFSAFDLLATLVLVVRSDNRVLFANASFEDVMGLSCRNLHGADVPSLFVDEAAISQSLDGARRHDFAALRFDAQLKRQGTEPFAVHVVVAATEDPSEVLIELLPQETQSRQDREERMVSQAQANKELIRNLAHEIKNPLGGIRGAAQLLEMEIESRELTEYTQVIVREADRLQTLVDRLLAPHRRPHVVTDVNIHEVCERVRSLILAEFPRGLRVQRDYDTSLPEFRGDFEQLIQAVLNIAHNAALAWRAHPPRATPHHHLAHPGGAPNHSEQATLSVGIGIACH
jgi:two-component system, NtrC family, nitrogen regulation sensor histidine kinase GlnL